MKQFRDSDYFVSEDGKVFYNGEQLKVHKNSCGYHTTSLGRYKKHLNHSRQLVHRMVAEIYCDKPVNCNIVHHKDSDKNNNHYGNLEWTTQQKNIHASYKTMSQVRNFRECHLFHGEVLLESFQSILEACRYAREHYGVSYSSLSKYHKVGEYHIKKV